MGPLRGPGFIGFRRFGLPLAGWFKGWRIALRGNAYKVSVTGLAFCIIWHDKHAGDWLTAFATPYPGCAGLLHGKACHTILRSLCSLTNRVPLPPLCRGQNKTLRGNLPINPPLEMTVLADTPIVISTEAERSGEISPSDGTGGITVGDLSTQSIINAFSLYPIPTCNSARDDGGSGQPYRHVKKGARQLFNPPLLSVFSPESLPVWRRRE